jgi:nitroimidazol reductase NimA-like FMN-containing flavoprotein (pyridoxamine 5'-phosphate oxidase superfamily)
MNAHRSEIPAWECLALVRHQQIGRVCIIDHGVPLTFPVNYRLIGSDQESQVVIRTAPATLIGQYEGPASFEVDQIDVGQRRAWSVILRGKLRRISGAHELPDPEPWLADNRHQWLVLDVAAISGRRFVGVPTQDGFSVDWQFTTS